MAIKTNEVDGKKIFEVYVHGFDARGQRIQWRRRGINSIRKAEEIEFELERKLAQLKEQGVSYTWKEWFDLAIATMKLDRKASTIQNYESYMNTWVNPHWSKRELRSITKQNVFDVAIALPGAALSPHSQRSLVKYIKRIFQMAVEEGHIDRNPAIGIRIDVPEVEQKVLTNPEVEIFLREAKATNHRFYPIWIMALFTGMRSGELFALQWSDIDFETRVISVNKQWTSKCGITKTKTRRSRVVPISDELLVFLKEWKLQRRSENVLPHHREWQNGEQAPVTRDFCVSIGVTPIKFHDLRATFITNLLARGESLARVMAIVGHTQIKTTNVYLRLAGVDIRGGTDKLGYSVPTGQPASVLQFVR